MNKIRKKHSSEFKLKAVIEILKGEKTAAQIASELLVHPGTLTEWKKQFIEEGAQIFVKSKVLKTASQEKEKAELFEQIGRLKMENNWLKKKLGIFQ